MSHSRPPATPPTPLAEHAARRRAQPRRRSSSCIALWFSLLIAFFVLRRC